MKNTDGDELELMREKILELLGENYHPPNSATNGELENLWQKFLKNYSEHFAVNHDLVMKSHH